MRLRPIESHDASLTFNWRTSDKGALLGGAPASLEAQAAWIQSRPESEFNWVIELASSRQPVGMLSLTNVDTRNRNAQTGRFIIGRDDLVRGKPVAVEAMFLLYCFAFEDLGLHRLYGYIRADNRRMIKWQQYLGMQQEGVWREHLTSGEDFSDAILLGLLARDFAGGVKNRMARMIKMAEAGNEVQ